VISAEDAVSIIKFISLNQGFGLYRALIRTF